MGRETRKSGNSTEYPKKENRYTDLTPIFGPVIKLVNLNALPNTF